MKKVLLLDIDGVISPLGKLAEDESYVKITGGWNKAYLRIGVIEWIKLAQEKYELVWGSSWGNESRFITDSLNLTQAPYIQVINGKCNYNWNKLDAIEQFCEQNPDKKIICVDDAATAKSLEGFKIPENITFIVPKNPLQGLSDDEMKMLLENN